MRNLIFVAVVFSLGGTLRCLDGQYVHPPAPPEAADFPQPPNDGHNSFHGPAIRPISVACWHAEPETPNNFQGGKHGFQHASAFVATNDMMSSQIHADTSFHQMAIGSFSAGGSISKLTPKDVPPGIFVSFKGHPILKVTSIEFPAQGRDNPPLFGPLKPGVNVAIDFMHEPRMGECYIYVAVWVAVKRITGY